MNFSGQTVQSKVSTNFSLENQSIVKHSHGTGSSNLIHNTDNLKKNISKIK